MNSMKLLLKRRHFICAAAAFAETFASGASARRLRPEVWADFLETYVGTDSTGATFVDYARVSHEDRAALSRYIVDMQAAGVSALGRADRFAYWVNLYNALTVNVILEHYPVASIRDISISPGLFSRGPWGRKLVTVDGTDLSLDDIENSILRPGWKDPRVHYVLNCGSRGCPNLRSRPYESGSLDADLDTAARQFIDHERSVRIVGERLIVSSIFDWYAADFGGRKSVVDHLRVFAGSRTLGAIGNRRNYDSHDYDWSLNDKIGK